MATVLGTLNVGLSQYASGVAQDEQKILELANMLSPTVVTGAKHVNFMQFNEDNAYQTYDATRGLSSKRTRILMGTKNSGQVDLATNGLEIPIDDQEMEDAGGTAEPGVPTALQQAKVLTLVRSAYLSHLSNVVTVAQAGVTAVAGKGGWSNANVDPIAEIDAQLDAISRYMTPTHMFMDVGAWRLAKNNPNVVKRFIAQGFTLDMFGGQLLIPNLKIELTSVSFNSLGFGNASQSKKAALGSECWITCNSPAPTLYDPSFMKTFSVTKDLFAGVREYREEQTSSQVYVLDWAAVPKVISTNLVRRIAVS